MSKIDNGLVYLPPQNSGPQRSGNVGAAKGIGHAGAVSAWPGRSRLSSFLPVRAIRKLLSPMQLEEADLHPLSQCSEEKVIADLSGMIVRLERHDREAGFESAETRLFKMMVEENIRRMLLVVNSRAAETGGKA